MFGTKRSSYWNSKRTAKARANPLSETDGAGLPWPFSMHITLDQDPLLGRGVMPAAQHMTL